MTIKTLDDSITRTRPGCGATAKPGRARFVVAESGGYDAEVVSAHRTHKGAMQALSDGLTLWRWDSYLCGEGGFRRMV